MIVIVDDFISINEDYLEARKIAEWMASQKNIIWIVIFHQSVNSAVISKFAEIISLPDIPNQDRPRVEYQENL